MRTTEKQDAYTSPFRRIMAGNCPHCGNGQLFKGWFRLEAGCSCCGHRFPIQEGSFLGAMAINYGMVVFGALPLWLLVWKLLGVELEVLFYGAVAIAILVPVVIYPLAWRIWIWICTDFLKEDNPYED